MSYWLADTNPLKFSKLRNNTVTDVLVIGGGISCLTTAYNLLNEGLKVVLIEDGFIGSGESGRTTAHITYALDDRYFQIEKTFGKHKAMLAANSHMTALYWIYNTIRHENINCNFRRIPGYLFLSSGDKFETLEQEYGATRRAGLMTEMIDKVPGVESLVETRGLKFPGQGQFHIMKYLKGLADSIVSNGGSIYTETKAEEITKEGATANGFTIKAKYIVVATNTPINDKLAIHTKQAAYRTYVIACKIRKSKLSYALW
jgi:glycine/D-amino acid oxidase-like deaminating enzyme